MIPASLSLYPFLVLSQKQKARIKFQVSWSSGNEKYCCFLFVVSRAISYYTLREKCPYSEFSCPYFPTFGLKSSILKTIINPGAIGILEVTPDNSLKAKSTFFVTLMVTFFLRKIFCGNLNEVVSLAEIDFTSKVTSVSANEIASFRFPRKIVFKEIVLYG